MKRFITIYEDEKKVFMYVPAETDTMKYVSDNCKARYTDNPVKFTVGYNGIKVTGEYNMEVLEKLSDISWVRDFIKAKDDKISICINSENLNELDVDFKEVFDLLENYNFKNEIHDPQEIAYYRINQ